MLNNRRTLGISYQLSQTLMESIHKQGFFFSRWIEEILSCQKLSFRLFSFKFYHHYWFICTFSLHICQTTEMILWAFFLHVKYRPFFSISFQSSISFICLPIFLILKGLLLKFNFKLNLYPTLRL